MAVINGTNGNDEIFGGPGNDTIYGKNGHDHLVGEEGNDSLHGDKGGDLLLGGEGNDNLYGKDGDDFLYGGVGDDNLHGDAGKDTLSGDWGNDTIKGGVGVSLLYGEDGDDDVYYNPFKGKLEDLLENNQLAESYLNGGEGKDVLNLFNDATYTGENGKTTNAHSYVYLDDGGDGHQYFTGIPFDFFLETGTFSQFEELKFEGEGGVTFNGSFSEGFGIKVTGTNTDDSFTSNASDDTFLGGGGNDSFFFGAGDTIESGTGDADGFLFESMYGDSGTAHLTGFNGAGKAGGDTLSINSLDFSDPDTQIVESGGKTTFTMNGGGSLEINTVGLVEGQDWILF